MPACPRCQTDNAPGAKFCQECAAPLVARCASCGTSASALAGGRKQVTGLFVDVSGFTSLSARLDPEEVHQLMLAEVHRYERTVNQFLGDGIMALFGAPIAHEDHSRRAVPAALGIARALEDLARR